MSKDKKTTAKTEEKNVKNTATEAQLDDLAGLTLRINDLEAQLATAQEQARRAQADYQNLLRRTQVEKAEFIKFANQDLVEQLLEPLRNLSLAAQALNDQGLNMVIDQFWAKLHDLGLRQIGPEIIDQPFDVETMEAVERQGESDLVKTVLSPGYILNGRVIQHAKVTVG